MSLVLTNTHKGICLIAIGIIMRDTGCSSEEVQELHLTRYRNLIAKKGKAHGVDPEDNVLLSEIPINELVS